MKTLIKYSSYFCLVLALCVMVLSGCSCSAPKPAPDPLVGYHVISAVYLDNNKAITDDYKDYIQKLPTKEKGYVGPIFFYENETGQHAVKFELNTYGKDVWNHYLFYDKDNKRINVIAKYLGQYWNP